MWKHFTPACIKTLRQKLLNVHWRSIPTTAPRPVKSSVELNKICLNNVVTQYGDQLYIQKNGIVTGDNHSVSLANIVVHYILQPIADVLSEAELFRWHNLDFCIRNIKWTHSTSTNFSFWEQWLGTNVPTSLHCRDNRRSWISGRQ